MMKQLHKKRAKERTQELHVDIETNTYSYTGTPQRPPNGSQIDIQRTGKVTSKQMS